MFLASICCYGNLPISAYFRGMMGQHIIEEITKQLASISALEAIAVVLSVIQVLLSYRNHVGLYLFGIVSCILFVTLFIESGLYAEALLQGYYIIMSAYGWYAWLFARKNKGSAAGLSISFSTTKERWIAFGIAGVFFVLLAILLHAFTDSSVPYWDALVSATAWAGMWLLAKRKLENWIWLNVSNAIAIPLLFYKALPLTALLTLFLFIVAVFGYFRWKRIMLSAAS
jgi:nicotinamide mononucleotide transporter